MTVVAKNHCRLMAVLFFLCCQAVAFGQLSANFTVNAARSGCSPLVVSFRDSSAGNPTQWRWDLGNGVTSLLQNPSTTYFNPGTYAVKLVIRNAAGTADSITKTDYVTVFTSPTAGFTTDRTTGCFPLPVQFTDASVAGSGSLVNWVWDFGDGTTSTQQNPLHTYTAAGNHTVTLRVTNSEGCTRTFTQPQAIQVAQGVTADFTNTVPGPCAAPALVNFTNTSTGTGALTYLWSFGDGQTSTQANPVHNYTTPGSYSVSLIATSAQGCADTMIRSNLISIGTINADFSLPDTVCVNDPFQLTNTSSPTPVISLWSFGNGSVSTDLHPTFSYAVAGSYSIRLVADFGGCLDSVSQTIYVSPRPQAAFTASPQQFCSVPAVVNFINQTPGGGTVVWDFGDGTSSTQNNPTHTYTTAGSYTVSLTVTNAAGCSQTITQTDTIRIELPQVAILGLPRNGCAPVAIAPVANVTSNHTLTNYLWSFGDGTTSTQPLPTHTYNNTGTYTVKLVYTTSSGCTDSVVMTNAVRVGTRPTAGFSINPTDVCAYRTVQFTDSTTGGADQWLWTFGDGGSSTSQHPTYQYSDTGWFHVQLIVYNNTCPDTLLITNAVHIRPPIAMFTAQNDCNTKYTKGFTDGSVGALTWFWTFGDGNTSTQQNPVHTYASTGNYSVTLTVTNDTCSHSYTQTVRVIDESANFSTTDTVICRNQTATFVSRGITAANIAGWEWNFGDGTIATTDSIATHTYTTAGNFTVRLIITDLLGCADTAYYPITVYGPTANFSVSSAVSCLANNLTNFTDLSVGDGTHPIIRWEWNYGDGTTDSSGLAPYQHSYAAAGNYTVSLQVRDAYGCTDIMSVPTAVIISQPTASFFSADTVSCSGNAIAFTNTSAGTGLQHVWSFGDGNTSTTPEPVHQYAAIGTYSIRLEVTDQYGCKDTLERPAYISISYPQARFTISDSVSTCPPLLVNFAHQSTDYTSLTWDFGDGTSSTLDSPSHFYTAAGIYYATLTVTGPGGCVDTAMKRIEVNGPRGSFSYSPLSGCRPLQVNFTGVSQDQVTYTWDFADGTIVVTTDSLISHTYTNAGEYIPRLILTDAGGCSVPIQGTDTIRVTGVTAGFDMGPSAFCNDGVVQFTNTSVGNDFITGYQWSFGDGAGSTSQHPAHHYTNPGIYTVSLWVTTQGGCRDSITRIDTVKVYANPVISITGDSSGCAPVMVRFNGQVNRGDTTQMKWLWNFGNGQTDTVQHPAVQSYSIANAYNITSMVVDENGCRDTATVSINAYPTPAVDAGADAYVCRGSFIQLQAAGADTYTWNPSASLSCAACPSPLAAPTDSTRYFVTGTSVHGCSAMDSVTIRVHQPFTLQVGAGDTVCVGTTVDLRATGADRYTWIPSTAVANPNAGITTATPSTTTVYHVIGRDNYNCFTDTGLVTIQVWPYPSVDAGPDKTVTVGSTLTMQPAYSTDVTAYQWTNPMQTLSCINCPTPVVQTRGVQNTYRIQVTNDGGCTSTDEVTINTICNGANLFIPNTFSPNADGKNERFYPRGAGLARIKSLRIYNRWGETVFVAANFNANDAAAGWDGLYKGKVLPPDVYVYTCEVVCQNNEVLTYHGNVTLLR